MLSKASFHPAVIAWFQEQFGDPTPPQAEAWPLIKAGRDVLIAAPTGSGKTLAAFLSAIDDLVWQADAGPLQDETQIVYVSPLKALSNDIKRNLEVPIEGIRQKLLQEGRPDVEIRSWVRTGDTAPAERQRMARRPPHIVVTTPESLYVLLGSETGRRMLSTTRTVIVDEIHAIAPNKRGSHLALSLERLSAICASPPLRIGLSATQKPIEAVARFLVGDGPEPCAIVDSGHRRDRDLALEVPDSPLESIMSAEVWDQVYRRLASLIDQHRTTLVFVNTRRMAERVTRKLSDLMGETNVAAHHGSLAKEQRLLAEQRLKQGKLKALVATASLELGIDIGDVDLVCQLGSPRAIATFLQRVGRSGHAVGGTPKGRLFPLSRDELVECAALLDSVHRGELDRLIIPDQPLDVLAQQIVAEVACREWHEDELFALIRHASPYRNLSREDFSTVIEMLSHGFSTRRGRRGSLLHHDTVNGVLRGRRGSRLTALTAGGTIPDNADYQVLLEPENHLIGTVNEDFAVESLAGDIFQLGNRSYKIQRVERGMVRVEDAHGMAPTIPFWLGEAPGRTDELSQSVSRLRDNLAGHLERDPTGTSALCWLTDELRVVAPAAEQLLEYLQAAYGALGCLPTQKTVVLERFFDEAGGMQLVIHSPFGSRINRAWGLALRKRFCRKFNFELQAAATEDNIVISLTEAHSFPLDEVAHYLHSASVRTVLTQAMLDSPMFTTRWRWVVGVALALPRFRGGRKVAPQLARMGAEDLMGAVFPDQIACAENLAGEREIPDHPLVRQAIGDSLTDAMDIEGLERLLRAIEAGEVAVVARELTQPSPLALEVLSARPYAYLDDAPIEERRTQAVMARRWISPEDAAELGRLDPEAIERVRTETWPEAENADELHDALVWLGFVTEAEIASQARWRDWLTTLAATDRAGRIACGGSGLWISAERASQFRALWPGTSIEPEVGVSFSRAAREWTREEALIDIIRGRLEGLGPVTTAMLASSLGLTAGEIEASLASLEAEGFVMRGHFTAAASENEWCERRLLSRIHHYTIKRLRAEIEPVSARDFLRFLFAWQHVDPKTRMTGRKALDAILAQLEGFEAPAAAWESEILTARLSNYDPDSLDERCLAGYFTWMRLRPRGGAGEKRASPVRSTPIAILPRKASAIWASLSPETDGLHLTPRARTVADQIRRDGASFFHDLLGDTGLLRSQLEEAIAELVGLGIVTSDSFGGLRTLLTPSRDRRSHPKRRRRSAVAAIEEAGRWSLVRRNGNASNDEAIEHVARTLLRRYGVVYWRLIEREAPRLPPWRDLLRVYRRLESRGEIRGGRFVAGFSGEQFALPDAVGLLRETRRCGNTETWITVSGADPLNLAGILTPGPKIAALAGNRVSYRDGIPMAALVAREVSFFEELESAVQWQVRQALLRGAEHAPSLVPEIAGHTARIPPRTPAPRLA